MSVRERACARECAQGSFRGRTHKRERRCGQERAHSRNSLRDGGGWKHGPSANINERDEQIDITF